ncbi:GST-like protein [Sphingomonas jejuensis]|uniref:GST-like protein n=1 Tax=Sphingomonas jejuensis TaxID=904715 RepID=A0ABX0XL28_9SPHN|nr:glutathione S-transferase family protein [Sphingomonas jejuensis]NJC33919.1 GST-like protein [Sphingomonas jejuensis]
MTHWTLYGVPGWGSTIAAGALAWVGEPVEFVDVKGFDHPGPARERLDKVNPLARVPTLVAPDGTIFTESAAIILSLGDRHPASGLVPAADDPRRAAFLNRLMWLVSVVYPTFTYRDYPERWAPLAAGQLRDRVDAFRQSLWRGFDADLAAGDWVLPGDAPTALDLYVGVMTHWRPGRDWFARETPALLAIAERTQALPALAPIFAKNFQSGADS